LPSTAGLQSLKSDLSASVESGATTWRGDGGGGDKQSGGNGIAALDNVIGADGQVLDGASDVDQATITGEGLPVAKTVGDEVFAGYPRHLAAQLTRVVDAVPRPARKALRSLLDGRVTMGTRP